MRMNAGRLIEFRKSEIFLKTNLDFRVEIDGDAYNHRAQAYGWDGVGSDGAVARHLILNTCELRFVCRLLLTWMASE